MRLPLIAVLLLSALPLAAQDRPPGDSYADAGARELVEHARARRAVFDTRITGYQVTAHERLSARLAVGGIEKLLFRRETAARIDWSPDTVRIEVLGAREAQPIVRGPAQLPPSDVAGMMPSLAFDPVDSEMLLRLDSTMLHHPLAPGSEALYRFASGDSTSIRLPDGREVRLIELRIAGRRPDPRLINGSFWVDAESHAVVRAGFRLSRGRSSSDSGVTVVMPDAGYDIDHVAIEYGLWDLHWWLPKTVAARGVARVGRTRFPLSYVRRYDDYEVQGEVGGTGAAAPEPSVASEPPCRPRRFGSIVLSAGSASDPARADSAWKAGFDSVAQQVAEEDSASLAEGRRCERAFIVTRSDRDLLESPVFTSSIYDDGGLVTEDEMRELVGLIQDLPETRSSIGRPSIQVLTPDLVRYNRVEGLSLGASALMPLGPGQIGGEVRGGTSGEVGARLSGVRTGSTVRSEVSLYRGVEAVDVASQPFFAPSSAAALLLGSDENDYFRGTGAELRLSPPLVRTQAWDLRLFAERQEPVRTRTTASLRGLVDPQFEIRENIHGEAISQAGATLRLRSWLGDDPRRLRARGNFELHGEAGDRLFLRPRLQLGADGALPGRVGFGIALAGGSALGDVPAQRAWQIGGGSTVRGHEAAAMRGEHHWLGRGELNWGSPLLRLAVFGDAGWAGDGADLWSARPLKGAGAGISMMDNLFRIDLGRGIGGGGYRLHLRLGHIF